MREIVQATLEKVRTLSHALHPVVLDEAGLESALRRRTVGGSPVGAGRNIARAIERLSPRQRAVIAGIYYREVKVRALAAELQVTPQAVTALHRRALAALRTILTEELGSESAEVAPEPTG